MRASKSPSGDGEPADFFPGGRKNKGSPGTPFQFARRAVLEQVRDVGLAPLDPAIFGLHGQRDSLTHDDGLDDLDLLERISRARSPDPRAPSLRADTVEADRREEHWMRYDLPRGRVLAGVFRVDHQRVRLAARPVVRQDVFLLNPVVPRRRPNGPNLDRVPGLVVLPSRQEVPLEAPLLLGLKVHRNTFASFHALVILLFR